MKLKTVAKNKKALHTYHIINRMEAGIVLAGTEVKSLRQGKAVMQDCYAVVVRGEVFLEGLHISPYEQGNRFNHDPKRRRKLLLHKKEIKQLAASTQEKGFTIIPISLYFKGRRVKVDIGIGRGKKLFDKRAVLKERDAKRTIERIMKEKNI